MKISKLLFLVPAVFIFVLCPLVSCKADVEEPEYHVEEPIDEPITVTLRYSTYRYSTIPEDYSKGKKVKSGTVYTEELLPELSSEYADFIGWKDDSGHRVNPGSIVPRCGTVYLSAIWTPCEFNIIYNLNGGELPSNTPMTYFCDKTVTLPTPKYEGYHFGGWYETPDFDGETITGWYSLRKSGDVKLYARWFDADSSDIRSKIENMTESGTITVTGIFGKLDVPKIKEGLNALYAKNPDILVSLDLSNVTKLSCLGGGCFQNCLNLYQILLPDSLTSIERCAFYGCSNLTKITIPDSVSFDGYMIFYKCTNLTEIRIPENATEIGDFAFYQCSSLSGSIIIPEGVEYFGINCFDGCSSLSEVKILNGPSSIGNSTFKNCSNLSSVSIPSSVKLIGCGSFVGCSNLKSAIFEDTNSTWYTTYSIETHEGTSSIGKMTTNYSQNAYTLTHANSAYYIYNSKY